LKFKRGSEAVELLPCPNCGCEKLVKVKK